MMFAIAEHMMIALTCDIDEFSVVYNMSWHFSSFFVFIQPFLSQFQRVNKEKTYTAERGDF